MRRDNYSDSPHISGILVFSRHVNAWLQIAVKYAPLVWWQVSYTNLFWPMHVTYKQQFRTVDLVAFDRLLVVYHRAIKLTRHIYCLQHIRISLSSYQRHRSQPEIITKPTVARGDHIVAMFHAGPNNVRMDHAATSAPRRKQGSSSLRSNEGQLSTNGHD